MALLNNADAIYFGDRHVGRVYLGSHRVWPPLTLTERVRALFAPTDQGGMWDFTSPANLYQDAAASLPVTGLGQPIGRADDLSGNGNHLSQDTTAARPTYTEDGVLHDGVDDILRAAAVEDWNFLTDGSGGFLGASGSFRGISSQNYWASTQSNAARSDGISVGGYSTDAGSGIYLGTVVRSHNWDMAGGGGLNPPVSDDEIFVSMVSVSENQATGYRGTAPYSTREYTPVAGSNPLSTGSSTSSAPRTVRRIIAISRVLTDPELALVNAWLMEGVE